MSEWDYYMTIKGEPTPEGQSDYVVMPDMIVMPCCLHPVQKKETLPYEEFLSKLKEENDQIKKEIAEIKKKTDALERSNKIQRERYENSVKEKEKTAPKYEYGIEIKHMCHHNFIDNGEGELFCMNCKVTVIKIE